ncbi:MAG: ankyrin repeat domain-containing protein [Alphaproteobacteria bacterium]
MVTQPEAQQEFFDAFLKEDPFRLEASLKAGANPDLKDTQTGFTYSLIIAIVHARRDILRLLLKYGANVEVIDETTGDTPLLVAARKGEADIVEALLDKGARMDVIDADNLTPAGIAEQNRNISLQQLFAEAAARREETALNNEILPLTAGTSAPLSVHPPLRLKTYPPT